MALALCTSATYFLSRRYQLSPGLIFPSRSCRVNFRYSRRRGIRCDAGEKPDQEDAGNAVAGSYSPSWVHVEPTNDVYAGWAPLESDSNTDRRPGVLQIGAGVALAIAFSLVTYTYATKGTRHAVVFSVSAQQEEKKDLPSRSSTDRLPDAHNPVDSDTSRTPSSKENKQEVPGENPQPDVASASDLHQKKSAPGQDSFPSKDVTKFSDEENALSTESFTDSDIESNEEYGLSDLEEVDNIPTSTAKELVEPLNDGLNPISHVKENDTLSTDDKLNGSPLVLSGDPIPTSDLAGLSADKSDGHELPSQSSSQVNVLENEKEQSDKISFGNSGSTESIGGPEESNSDVAKNELSLSAESKDETFTVSASLVVPQGAAEDILEFLGLDTESNENRVDLSEPEPGYVSRSPSVLEIPSSSQGSEFWHSESVKSLGIPAPSTPSAAAQARPGSVVVPATVDHEQEQALAALQALKVIEHDVEPGGICTRREYARWLIAITGALARTPAQKVFPAMYIETVSELAFNDVVPEDPDFPYIQGLAEAGLISSNLSRHDADEDGRSTDGAIFLPDSPLSRQDLVCWKVALDGHSIQAVDKQKLKAQTGFMDVDRINDNALPFLAKDLTAGERSIIATAFGYTRRFQPGKPVTRAQVAMALVTGEAADVVTEELTRLEADDIAEAAVVAELALEARAHKHVDEYFKTELKLEKDYRVSVENQLEGMKNELDKVMKEREDQRISLESIQAAVQAERDLLHRFRQDLEEQYQALTTGRMEVGIEKDRLVTLRKEAEECGQALADNKAEVEVEKKALILARLWAEDEAKKARAHAKLLEEARKRWEGQGIQVRVDKDLDDDNIPALGWHYSGPKTKLNKFLQRPPVQDILARAGDLKSRIVERFVQLLEAIARALTNFRIKIAEYLQVVKKKGGESLHAVRGKAHILEEDAVSVVSKKAKEVQDATRSTAVGISSSFNTRTRKIADGFRGEAQKLAGKFKS